MRKMFLLFSHQLTPTQISDARYSWSIDEFVVLEDDLQKIWSHIPPELESLDKYLQPIKDHLKENITKNDVVLVQGDFGGCYEVVNLVKQLGAIAIYSTTTRDVIEKEVNGKIIKTSRFEHVRFRKY
jgi:hypothetical protein